MNSTIINEQRNGKQPDDLMAGLRRKLEKNPAKPRYILTEIGVGYRLTDE